MKGRVGKTYEDVTRRLSSKLKLRKFDLPEEETATKASASDDNSVIAL